MGALLSLPGGACFGGDAPPDGVTVIPELSSGSGDMGAWVSGGIQGNVLRETNPNSLSSITESVEGNSGLVNINQSSGNLNNQANVRAIAVSPGPGAPQKAVARDFGVIEGNIVETSGGKKTDLIQDSLRNNTGVIGVNQSAGSLNTEHNLLAFVVGEAVSLTEAEMAGVRSRNKIVQKGSTERVDLILDSFGNTRGMVQITQAAGDLNVLGNTIAFSYREITLR